MGALLPIRTTKAEGEEEKGKGAPSSFSFSLGMAPPPCPPLFLLPFQTVPFGEGGNPPSLPLPRANQKKAAQAARAPILSLPLTPPIGRTRGFAWLSTVYNAVQGKGASPKGGKEGGSSSSPFWIARCMAHSPVPPLYNQWRLERPLFPLSRA